MMKSRFKSTIVVYCIVGIMCMLMVGCGSPKADAVSQKMIDDINALGEIQLDDEEAINKLIDRYSTLTDSQKNSVSNYAALLEAQDRIDDLRNAQNQANAEYLSDPTVQMCVGVLQEFKARLKNPDSLKLKRICNYTDNNNNSIKVTCFYVEYESEKDAAGVVFDDVMYAVVFLEGSFQGQVQIYENGKDLDGNNDLANYYYPLQKGVWDDLFARCADEIIELDVDIIQNSL